MPEPNDLLLPNAADRQRLAAESRRALADRQRQADAAAEVERIERAKHAAALENDLVARILHQIGDAVRRELTRDPESTKASLSLSRANPDERLDACSISASVCARLNAMAESRGYTLTFGEHHKPVNIAPDVNDGDRYRPGQQDQWVDRYFDLIQIQW